MLISSQTEGIFQLSATAKYLLAAKAKVDWVGGIAASSTDKLRSTSFYHSYTVIITGIDIPIMNQEVEYFTTLLAAESYLITDDMLQIICGDSMLNYRKD